MASTSEDLKGVHINRHAPLITHLLFASDRLIFGEAAIEGVRAFNDRLEIYAHSSGQLINFDKSSTFFSSNVSEENREKKYIVFQSFVKLETSVEDWFGALSLDLVRLLATRIMSIPIPLTNQSDKLVRFSENSGIYSVKSGYKALIELSNVDAMEQGYGREYRELSSTLKHPKPRVIINWYPLPPNWVKVNVDAGFSATKQKAVSGFLIRNAEGHLVKSVVLDEAIAILHGIQLALEIGFMQFFLKNDSKTVIKNLQSIEENYLEIRSIIWGV
ncbi:hypothetical protein Goshw_000432, partial [Gossypium schwendimanii]|nr:hypothetical protein [Gossypium schwendimanii]